MKKLAFIFLALVFALTATAQPTGGGLTAAQRAKLNAAATTNQMSRFIDQSGMLINQRQSRFGGTNTVYVPTNFLSAMTVDFANSSNCVVVLHPNGTTNIYPATANTDAGRAQALANALWAYGGPGGGYGGGDIIYLSAGRYDIDGIASNQWTSAVLDLSFEETDGLGASVVGAGRTNTVLYTDGVQPFVLGMTSSFRDLTVEQSAAGQGAFSENTFTSPSYTAGKFNVFLNCNLSAAFDMFVLSSGGMNLYFQSCNFYGCYDVFANTSFSIGTTNNVNVISDCTFYIDAAGGLGGLSEQDYARVSIGRMAKLNYVYNTDIVCTNGTKGTWGIHGDGNGSVVYLNNVRINAAGHTNVWQINNFTNDTVYVDSESFFNRANVTNRGTIKYTWPSRPTLPAP